MQRGFAEPSCVDVPGMEAGLNVIVALAMLSNRNQLSLRGLNPISLRGPTRFPRTRIGRRRLLKDGSHKIVPVIRILDAREEPLIFPLGSEQLNLPQRPSSWSSPTIGQPDLTTWELIIGRIELQAKPGYKIKRSSTQLRYLPFNPSASTTLSSTFVGWPSSFHTTPKPPR